MTNNCLLDLGIWFEKAIELITSFEGIIWLFSFPIVNGSYERFRDLQVIDNFVMWLAQLF